MSFAPYVFYSGNCEKAFTFYHQVLGGDLQIMKVSDAPGGADAMPGLAPDAVMHAALVFPSGMFMGSDDPTGDDGPKSGIAVAYTAETAAEAERVFNGLSAQGVVTMPFEGTFWSAGFGAFTDQFGVNWLIDTDEQPAAAE